MVNFFFIEVIVEIFRINYRIKKYVPQLKIIFFSKYLVINLSNVTMEIGYELPRRYSYLYKLLYVNKYGIMNKEVFEAFAFHALCYKYSNRLEVDKSYIDDIFKSMLKESMEENTPIVLWILTKLLGNFFWNKK